MSSAISYEVLDEALDSISSCGPEFANGLTNHGPMASEALCAMARADAVRPWLDGYRKGLIAWPPSRERILSGTWPEALGQLDRVADWRAFFRNELENATWREALGRWTTRLAAGFSAAATHGVLRAGHAARALAISETAPRIRELADGLAYWAATYETLPTDMTANASALNPREAILNIPLTPAETRRFTGSITSSLAGLREFPPFAPVIGLADLSGGLFAAISNLTETFARVYLANANDPLSAIVFIHGVTSVAILRAILPCLESSGGQEFLRYGWQSGCALYAAFGARPAPVGDIDPPKETRETLIDMAIATRDEHAIKFTQACIQEDFFNPSPVYLSAARHAIGILHH